MEVGMDPYSQTHVFLGQSFAEQNTEASSIGKFNWTETLGSWQNKLTQI